MQGSWLFFFAVLSTAYRAVYSENQYFKVRPTDQESKEGDDVEFQCHIGNREGDVQWSKDGFLLGFDPKIPGYPRYSMDVKEEEGIYNLHIKEVNFQDEGEFQCQVGPALNHTPIRAEAQLRILIPPEYISVNGLGQDSTVEVKDNTSVRLVCQAVGSKPPAQLKWFRDNTQVPKDSVQNEERKDKSRFISTSYLHLRPMVSDDGAKFACEAYHKALTHRMKTEVTLSVLHPPGLPRIEGYEEGTVVKAGEALTLMCISEGGNPLPALIWYRGNAQIDATHYLTEGERATANNLTFVVSAADNTGAYHCHASNSATKEPLIASIKLSVYYLSNKLWIIGPKEAPRGETVTLMCETDVSNPRSDLSWIVEGTPILAGEEAVRATTDGWITTSNLTITLSRQEPDTKTFTCEAKNAHVHGTASATHTLRVVYAPKPPTILGYDAGTALRVGDIQRFNCVSVGGNPAATLRWFKGDREISTPVLTSGSGVSSELVIRVQLDDNGSFYRCEASNSALKKPLAAFVRLTVKFPPASVNITLHPEEPRVGDNITLTCTSSSSNPLSRISWKRDGLFLRDHREETLGASYGGISTRSRITFVVKATDDASQFVCQAKSDEFKTPVTETFVLRVKHPPRFLHLSNTVDIIERSSTIINRTAVAYPEMIVYEWRTMDGDSIGEAGRVFASGPLLHVRNASREDAKMYVCIAENEEGHTKGAITLNVLYGAAVETVSIASPSGPVFEGSEATLECRVSARPVKKDMVTWRVKGAPARSQTIDTHALNRTKSVLRIRNVTRELRGLVECWADNGIGGPSVLSVMLNVLYKPIIFQSGGEMSDGLGRLRCTADGSPNVTVTWSFNGTAIRSMDKYGTSISNQDEIQWTSLLIVRDVNEADYGIYTCTAKNVLGYDSADIILNDKGVTPDVATTSISSRDGGVPGRMQRLKLWWFIAAAGGIVSVLLCCILFICGIRKRSNRTTPERSQQTRHIDISNLTADDVCNKLLLSADVKSILLCSSEKPHMPMHDFKGHSVFTIEDTYKLDKIRSRQISSEEKDQDSKTLGSSIKDTFIEEIPQSLDQSKGDCPDILRNEKCLCLTTSKESGEPCTSPQSDSPESPRFNSTPSGSTGSCLSVYHEKTSIRSLGDIEGAAVMKLHPIMVLRIDEDSYKYSSET